MQTMTSPQGPQPTPTNAYNQKAKLRWMIRMHVWNAFKFTENGCTFNLIWCAAMIWEIIKVGLITDQMIKFGGERAKFISMVDGGNVAIRRLMLKDWSAGHEELDDTPFCGQYALYHREDLKAHVEHVIQNFHSYPWNTIAFYRLRDENWTRSDIELCIKTIANERDLNKQSLNVTVNCFLPSVKTKNSSVLYVYSEEFDGYWKSETFESFLSMHLKFLLHSIRTDESSATALCLKIEGVVSYLNTDRNGQVKVDLDTTTTQVPCAEIGYGNLPDTDVSGMISKPVARTIVVFSAVSLLASLASLIFGVILTHKIRKCVMNDNDEVFPKDYSMFSYLVRCVRLWDVFTVTGDCLTLTGTVYLIVNKELDWTVTDFDVFTVCLGVGCILSWICLLRFFRFHGRFHILFKALYRAMGDVLAYMMCVCVLFVGFVFCGYVVLGPYNVKFQTLTITTECLFSLVNGDEIFSTLNALDEKKTGSVLIWWFSRFYICLYVSIFTIVILNLLIAIFNTVYEEIQSYYGNKVRGVPSLNRALNDFIRYNSKSGSDVCSYLRQSILAFKETEKGTFTKYENAFRQEIICALDDEKNKRTEEDPLKAFILKQNPDSDVESLWKFSYLRLLPPRKINQANGGLKLKDRRLVSIRL